jgi:hypothetical protein
MCVDTSFPDPLLPTTLPKVSVHQMCASFIPELAVARLDNGLKVVGLEHLPKLRRSLVRGSMAHFE